MDTVTLEDIIAQIERGGWRLSNLSHVQKPNVYSCILERKKLSKDGFSVFASSDLKSTAKEAVEDAWANATKPISEISNPARKFVKGRSESLAEKSTVALRLERALRAMHWARMP